MSAQPEANGEQPVATQQQDGGLPIDPDPDTGLDGASRPPQPSGAPFAGPRRSRWPRLRPDVIAAVFAGGCAGGAVRYAVSSAAHPPADGFPWATFAVNLTGAFILPVVIVIAADLVSSRYLRPLLGTGFCGALTTFSSVVVTADQLVAHHHPRTASLYLFGTVVGGLAAAAFGLVFGRAIATNRSRARSEERSAL